MARWSIDPRLHPDSLGMRLPLAAPKATSRPSVPTPLRSSKRSPAVQDPAAVRGRPGRDMGPGRVGQWFQPGRERLQHGDRRRRDSLRDGQPEVVTIDGTTQAPRFQTSERAAVQAPRAGEGWGGNRHSGSSGLGLGLYIARQIAISHGAAASMRFLWPGRHQFTARLHR